MAFGKIEIDTEVIESKVRIFHKHLGNFINDLNKICSNCGSVETVIDRTTGDRESYHKVKKCSKCDSIEFMEEIIEP